MERKTSSLRFTRGRLAALLSAVVLVTIVVFSLTFYHLCLHAKRMEVLTQGDRVSGNHGTDCLGWG